MTARLVIPTPKSSEVPHPRDIARIIRVCKNHGYLINAYTAQWAWERYSESYAAGWLMLPALDADLFMTVRDQLDVEVSEDP